MQETGPEERPHPTGVDREVLALETELGVFYRRARAAVGELARAVHPDLDPAAYGLLSLLAEDGERRATDIAAYFGVGKATMSRQLRALEEAGLLERRTDPADGRAFLVRLTEDGGRRFRTVSAERRDQWLRHLAAWDREDVVALTRLLHRFNELNAR
ncbi:MarR family winged helix-turn-helix transcriptional regulator [Streptomyces polyrhachis]|uniref:MarR family winged helix-turn-helix transcriptional regulator n=1 Tax=Streptomyces polyrhachis TaxID=1282885 RepID=A0ABW2GK46_9ACTN